MIIWLNKLMITLYATRTTETCPHQETRKNDTWNMLCEDILPSKVYCLYIFSLNFYTHFIRCLESKNIGWDVFQHIIFLSFPFNETLFFFRFYFCFVCLLIGRDCSVQISHEFCTKHFTSKEIKKQNSREKLIPGKAYMGE